MASDTTYRWRWSSSCSLLEFFLQVAVEQACIWLIARQCCISNKKSMLTFFWRFLWSPQNLTRYGVVSRENMNSSVFLPMCIQQVGEQEPSQGATLVSSGASPSSRSSTPSRTVRHRRRIIGGVIRTASPAANVTESERSRISWLLAQSHLTTSTVEIVIKSVPIAPTTGRLHQHPTRS